MMTGEQIAACGAAQSWALLCCVSVPTLPRFMAAELVIAEAYLTYLLSAHNYH
jgi:hypothetical protein